MNRLMSRLSMVLMAFFFTGCHSWQSDHSDCEVVNQVHYTPSELQNTQEIVPRMTSAAFSSARQFALMQLAYQSLVPEAEAATAFGGSIVMSLVVQRALATQAAEAALLIADQYIVLANNARAAGQAAEAAKYMSQSGIWEEQALAQAHRAGAATESLLYLGASTSSAVSALGVLLPSQYVIDQWMQGNIGYYDGYYYDQASNRGYDHGQGVGVLDGWLDGRHGGSGGSGGGDSEDGHVCEYDNFFMPAGDPDGDDPCKDHRKKGKSIFPRTEEPTGTFTLQVLLGSGHWQDTVVAMQQHQLETEMPLALVYEAKVLGHMDFPFIRTYTMVWPQGHTTTYYQDPSSGEMVFAFGAEINGQFLDASTGEYYGEMFPGQAEVTVYTGNHVYGIAYQ
ncbi:MAG: hypothetical protein P8J32_00940 [bacterium]|nr:hypothetical protein [bacterium]